RPANDAVESLIRRINTHPNYLEIELKNFDQQEITLFIDHSLGRSFDRLVDFAWECCSGHPFYSAAFLQVLQQCSDWQSNTGTGYLDFIWRDIENLDIPSGVIEHIRRRLASLSLEEIQLLRGLALFQRHVPLEVLASLVCQAQNDVLETAVTLATEGLVDISGGIQLTQVGLKGNWLARVIRQDTPPDELIRLYALAACSLEREFLKSQNFDLKCQLTSLSLKARDNQLINRYLKGTIHGLFERQLYSKAASLLEELFSLPHLLRERRGY